MPFLIFAVANRARERYHISYVCYARKIHYHTLKAQTVARVNGAAETTKVGVPPVVFAFKPHFVDALIQNVQTFFALTAADKRRFAICSGDQNRESPLQT